MMRARQVLTIWGLLVVYIFFGAYMFYAIERPLEEETRRISNVERKEIQELLQKHYEKGVARAQAEILERLNEYCGKPFSFNTFNVSNGTARVVKDTVEEKPFLWSFYNSLLFVICTLSTIGYGNLAPKSRHGRILDVIYGLIGIPFNGIIMVQMGEYFGSVFVKAHSRYKQKDDDSRWSLFLNICRYLIPGVVIFIFFPAGLFVYFEDWYFDTGVYYAFVTLATIGYGDLVAGQNGSEALEYQIFKVMVLVWILFGLGYMVMIVTMITRAMRSKKVRSIEKKLAYTIKQTQNKIWNEFTQDLTYVRRMMNEMYLLKFKPVYKDELIYNRLLDSKNRSQSAPNLTEWPVLRKKEIVSSSDDEEDIEEAFNKHRLNRRRAYSENVMTPQLARVMSEGDLSKIDRNATFGPAGNIEPGALLARVVDALGTPIGSRFSSSDEEDEGGLKFSSRRLSGIHGFSDAEILASENHTRWPSGGKRSRAHSESTPPFKRFSINEEQRTWSGVNHHDIHNFMKMRENGNLKHTDSKSSKSSLEDRQLQPPPSAMRRMSMAAMNFFNPSSKTKPLERKDSKKKRRTGNTNSLFPSIPTGKRMSLPEEDQPESMLEQINYLSHTSGRRASIFNALTSELTPRSDSNIPISPILEQTSVADFIRLISSLQSRLDPNKPLTHDSLTNVPKGTSVASLNKDSPLSALFTQRPPSAGKTDSTQGSKETISTPQAILRRRVSINPQHTVHSIKPRLTSERRFSLIPPMDVDHPSGQRRSLYDNLDLRKRSTSQSPLNEVRSSTVAPVNQRLRRLSLAGSARYISSKNQNRDGSRGGIKLTPTVPAVVVSNPQGRRKFSVRPVESATTQPTNSSGSTSRSQPLPTPPKITIEPVPDEETDQSNNRKLSTDSLEDVIVVRL